jgi:hypothetical protein
VEEARYHQPGRRMRFSGKVRLSVARMLILLDAGIGKTKISVDEMTLGSADSRSFRRKQSTAHYQSCSERLQQVQLCHQAAESLTHLRYTLQTTSSDENCLSMCGWASGFAAA